MKRIVLTLAVIVVALGVTLIGARVASATDYDRVPYCSAQDEQPQAAVEDVDLHLWVSRLTSPPR